MQRFAWPGSVSGFWVARRIGTCFGCFRSMSCSSQISTKDLRYIFHGSCHLILGKFNLNLTCDATYGTPRRFAQFCFCKTFIKFSWPDANCGCVRSPTACCSDILRLSRVQAISAYMVERSVWRCSFSSLGVIPLLFSLPYVCWNLGVAADLHSASSQHSVANGTTCPVVVNSIVVTLAFWTFEFAARILTLVDVVDVAGPHSFICLEPEAICDLAVLTLARDTGNVPRIFQPWTNAAEADSAPNWLSEQAIRISVQPTRPKWDRQKHHISWICYDLLAFRCRLRSWFQMFRWCLQFLKAPHWLQLCATGKPCLFGSQALWVTTEICSQL